MLISSDTSENKLFQLSITTFFLLAIIAGQAAFGGRIYVKPSGSGSGSSWLNAYGNLQYALNFARNGDEIWVSAGRYKPSRRVGGSGFRYQTFRMKNGVSIYGGFAGTEDPSTFDLADRDFEANETVLSGDLNDDDDSGGDNSENCYHVFYHSLELRLNATAVLDGFTITAGNADRSGRHGSGGGMSNYISNSPTVRNCMFIGNSAKYGGGMHNIYGSNPTVSNCAFIGNSVLYGGGMGNHRSSPTVSNCTFAGNSAFFYGGGMDNFDLSIVTISNCIFWGNNSFYGGNEIALHFSSLINVDYCDVEGSLAGIYDNASGNIINWGIGNIDVDPLFVDPFNDDFHLKSEAWRWDVVAGDWTWDGVTSRCIDAGNPGSPLGDELLSIPGDPDNLLGENIRINMGVYGGTAKASMPPYGWVLLGDLTADGIVNLEDVAAQSMDWPEGVEEPPGDLDRDGTIDTNDFAILVKDWMKETSWLQP